MQRTSLYLAEGQLERLAHHSERTGATQTELIRRAIEDYLHLLDFEEERLLPARQKPAEPQ